MSEFPENQDEDPPQVTDDLGQWNRRGNVGLLKRLSDFSADVVRFHSLDESSSSAHRASWSGFEEAGETGEERNGRQFHPSSAFHRPMSPGRLHVMTREARRYRSSSGSRKYGSGVLKERSPSDGLVGHSVSSRLLRLSRDATQPSSGSVTDLRGGTLLDDEETDVLPALGAVSNIRPRSFTCPDIKVIQRRTKIKLMHRPPTPTPGDDLLGEELATDLQTSCNLSNSGDIFVHDEEDELPVIAETS